MTFSTAPRSKPSAREILGVPVLPPGAVTAATNRIRAAIGALHARMAPPPVRILEGLFGLLEHRVLVALCAAGVPDALTAPTTPAELATRIGVDAERLERLLRFAAAHGWVRIDGRGLVRPTSVTSFLRTDHPSGWRAWVDFAGGDEVVAAVGRLSADPRITDAFAAANGRSFFDWMKAHRERGAVFDRAMAAGGRMHGLALTAAFDWSCDRQVCDVGGGTGALLAVLLDLVPTLNGTVLELPDVAARSVQHPRLRALGGDAFAAVPGGYDTYLLVSVLHDWNDADAQRILQRVADAAAGTARIIVVDSPRTSIPRDDLALSADVLMAALTNGGRERDTAAFAALGRACRLKLRRSVRLASGSLAHEFVRATGD
jgi:O-methyltransferase domain